MFRSPACRLAAVGARRLPLRAITSPAIRAARYPRTAPATAVLFPRFQSTTPPTPPGSGNNGNRQDSSPPVNLNDLPIPNGWVRLTENDRKKIELLLAPMQMPLELKSLMDVNKIPGLPEALYDIMVRKQTGEFPQLGMMDALKAIRHFPQMLEDLQNFQRDQDALRKKAKAKAAAAAAAAAKAKQGPANTNFDSKKPGEGGGQQQQQKQPWGQQEGQPEEQGGEGKHQQQSGQEGHEEGEQQQGGQGRRKGGPPPPRPKIQISDTMSWVVGAILLYPLLSLFMGGDNSREITWQELRRTFLDKGLVKKLIVDHDRVKVELDREAVNQVYPGSTAAKPGFHYYFTIGSIDAFERRLDEAQQELGIPSSDRIPVAYASESHISSLLIAFGPTLMIMGLLIWSARRAGAGMGGGGSGVFGFGKSKAKEFNHDAAVKVKFADVAGMDEAKAEIMEFGRDFVWPPGTGKTLLAKATAGESEVPFYSVSGSEFVEMFVGVGASRVRDLFATARKNAPCIIFIDEIDAVGRSRSEGGGFRGGGNDERESTLNQILTEMDGFNTSEQVVVLAGTNRPDVLDKALLRPGRFDRHIHIDRPTMKGRQEIFRVHLKKILTHEDMDYLTGRLAALTPGFAGADIANAVNEAALIAARANAPSVSMIHFEQAIERVIGGLERKSLVLDPEEKRTVAYHEAGHAVCGWYFRWADPLLKVSIIPRGQGALGYAQYLPATDAYLMSTNQLMDRMAMTLGGRVSEEIHFPTVTTGASDDFKKVTHMATTMVTQWGMSKKLGPLHFNNDENQLKKPFAESTAQMIDAEVRRIVDEAYKQCKDLLTVRKKEIGIVAEELLRKEVLSRDDLVRLLGPREWPDKEEFSKYFDGKGTAAPPFPTESTDTPGGAEPAMKEDGQDKR
ncbi:peptidase family M41-domain-containing protein [Apiosordaria backusii]|uniref:Peptidase family M41-domain-containing protein n=1 Tax=Apiosordaria backusii TaxID=314023 RepID=A0AA40K1E2_9PEZI|nr:peptidase family M41-domain-containing protein [Apiosordaria backusii]